MFSKFVNWLYKRQACKLINLLTWKMKVLLKTDNPINTYTMNRSWQSLIESRAQNKQISPTHLSITYIFTFQGNCLILLVGNGLWRVFLTVFVSKNRFNIQNFTLNCDKKKQIQR